MKGNLTDDDQVARSKLYGVERYPRRGALMNGRPGAAGDAVRILHVAESARGGVGTYLNEVLPELRHWRDSDGRACQMRVVLPAEDRFMLEHVDDGDVITYPREARNLPALGRLARTCWQAIVDFRPDIVHLHSSFAGVVVRPLLLAVRLRHGLKPKVIYSPHGWAFQMNGTARRQKMIADVERHLARLTDRIVVLSDSERAECIDLGFPAAKLVRIYNGIDAEPVTPTPTSWDDPRLKVFFIGRFDRQKGLDVLAEAARMAPDRICVRCAGTQVVSEGEDLHLPDNFELLGWLNKEEIAGQLRVADIVAVPSRWEGFGLVAIEAMRVGVPVVASRVGGLPEVVDDGVTGRLVPPDEPDALLAALTRDDAATRAQMAAAGRRRFQDLFTASQSAGQLGRVYSEILHPTGAA